MRKILAKLLLINSFLFLYGFSAQASHAVGIDIYYQCLGGNQYKFFVNFYRDCDGISAPTSVSINLNSASCGINTNTTLSLISNQNVSQICNAQINNTSCDGGSLPGIEQYVYSGTFTLPQQCSDWVVSYSLCCRNGGITNLASPSSQNLYVQATINNTNGNCNNSPQFSALPTPYLCVGQPFSFNNGAVDPDGNTLVYSLINPMSAAGTNIPYVSGYTPTNPMAVTGSFNFDPATGQMSFTPNQIQQGVITILVQEYDNGMLVGTTMRDIQVVVINCSNTPPTGSGVNGSTTSYNYDICSGSSFCFDINTTDADANATSMTWNNGIPGGTFTTSGSPFVTGTFCWTPTANDVGTHYFTVTVQDNACPIPGLNTYIFEINVNPSPDPPVNAGPDQNICLGESTTINATTVGTGATFSWSPATGLSCSNCQNPTVTVTSNQIYTVTASYPSGCSQTDQVAINVAPSPSVSVFPANISICSGGSALLTANSATATSYSWSPGGMTGATVNVNPASTTTYTVTATNNFGCTANATSTVTVSPPPPTEVCNNIYVTPTGNGSGDSPTDPTNLASALLMSQCNNATVKMAIGTYTINNPITDILGYTTLEGGYDPGNNWTKTSQPGATTIYRTNLNPEGPANAQRLVAIYMNSASYFRFQDLTIEVADAVTTAQQGMSTYGIHMTACSNYDIVRCQIIAGDASNGVGDDNPATYNSTWDGANGSNGGNGATGSGPQCTCNFSTDNGGNGGAGGGAGAGGLNATIIGGSASTGFAGGAGGNGRPDNSSSAGFNGTAGQGSAGCAGTAGTGGNADSNGGSTPYGGNGGAGGAGTAGTSGTTLTSTFAGGFFIPGSGTNGTPGAGGCGGGGAGGAGRDTDGCDAAGGGGSGGGGGGGGGGAGRGAYGGGSSFAIYLFNNGANGNLTDCSAIGGNPGAGGTGGKGGNGGNGGTSSLGNGCTNGDGDGNRGGTGGAGGAGGAGGNGGNGPNGISQSVYLDGTITPLVSSTTNFNLTSQPIIFAENISCTNNDIDLSSGSSNTWNYGSASNPVAGTGTTTTTQYTGLGRKNIQFGANTYTGFVNITLDGVTDPDINSSALEIAPDTFVVCQGSSADFFTTAANFVEFSWNFGGAISPNTYSAMNLTNLTFNTVGTYTITLEGRTDCCGWSNPVEVVLIVDELPTINISGDLDICFGVSTTLTATSNVDSIIWSPNYGINTDTGLTVIFNPPVTTDYLATALSQYGICSATDNFTVTVNSIDVTANTMGVVCADDGSATAIVSNGSGSYTYLWNDSNNQTTATATNLYTGNYQVIVTDVIHGCMDTTFAYVGASPAAPVVYISNSQNVSCYLGSDGSATANVAGGSSPFNFTWTDLSNNSTLLTQNNVNSSTLTNLSEGNYNVFVTDNNGCAHTVDFSISQPDTIVYVIDSTIVDATCYFTNDGSITIQADGGSGGFTYLWDANAGSGTTTTANGLNPGNYGITITDMNGCSNYLTFNVNGPTVELFTDAGLPDSVCGSEYMLQAIPTSGITTGTWLPLLTSGPGTASINDITDPNSSVDIDLNYGTYVFYWMEDNNQGCTDTAVVDIVFIVPPTVNAGSDDTICNSLTYNLSGTSNLSTNIWNVVSGPGNVSFTDDADVNTSITVDQIGIYEIELLGVNQINCEARDTISLYFSSPTFATTIVDDECSANIGSITFDNAINYFGNIQYSIDNGTTFQSSNIFSNLGADIYNLIIQDDLGCTATDVITLINNGTLTFIDTTQIDPTCFGYSDGQITVDATSTALPLSYNINGGLNQANNVFSGLMEGTYSVVIIDMNNCTDTVIVTLMQPDSITFDTVSIQPLCFGACDGEISLGNTQGGTGTYAYSIDNGTSTQSSGTFINVCSDVYDLVVSDQNGCQSNMTLTLNEPTALTLNISIDSASCFGTADGEVTATVTGGTPTYSYNWNGLALSNQFQATGVAAGNYDLVITDANGCTIDTLNYEVGQPVAVNVGTISSVNPTCFGLSNGSLTVASASNIISYSIDGINYQTSNQFTNLNSGTYTVFVQDLNGCVNSTTHTINSHPQLTLSASSSPTLICVGQSSTLSATASGGVGQLTYSWNQGLGNGALQSVSPTVANTYEVTVNDENGCATTTQVTVNVNQPITVTAFSDVTICPGQSTSISAFATGGDGNGNPLNYTYVWSNGSTGSTLILSPNATTTYSVYATDGCGSASNTASVTVTVSTPPLVDFTLNNNQGCVPVNVSFNDLNGGIGSSCLWNFGDGFVSTDCGSVIHEYTQPGIYDVSYTVTNSDGCSTSLTYTDSVEVYDYPIAGFTFNPEVGSITENVITFTNTSIGAESYSWIFGDSVSPNLSNLENPVATYPYYTGGEYEACLIVTNQYGCQDSVCQTIVIEDQFLFYVPNTFTPNSDGHNDEFLPSALGIDLTGYKLMVFNRWGQLIFETSDVNYGWDGTYMGDPCAIDTYIWKIEFSKTAESNLFQKFTGHVNLLR
ncbi:MAG: gliding motility-associated C-terminal domain-containing protein [Flavobacteriales bacterium]|nr:gliding motility-associated C-terminal domain-containing protein [Flavobacteriales bacterium]